MSDEIAAAIQALVAGIAAQTAVRAVGISGGDRPYPQPGEADIDVFLYCTAVPSPAQRLKALQAVAGPIKGIEIARINGGPWGQGDRCLCAGVETWLLYFSEAEALAELEDILAGKYPGRLGEEYYPLGRLAMWRSMRALYDPDGFLTRLRDRLATYPEDLARTVLTHHLSALEDVENLERAVRRQDVFFYHHAFEIALDHFFQALFALNRTFFPSRKRSAEAIRQFTAKPTDCEARLRQAIAAAAQPETLGESYRIWQSLIIDLQSLDGQLLDPAER
jgi:hypothetical protein